MPQNSIGKATFIGRKTEQKRFRQLLTLFVNSHRKSAVLISGPGGYGKTTLALKLEQIATENYGLPLVKVDWEEYAGQINTVSDSMQRIALELVKTFDCSFRRFFERLEADKVARLSLGTTATEPLSLGVDPIIRSVPEEEGLATRIKLLSIDFLADLTAELSNKQLIISFDTYERIDYHRQSGSARNFCDLWVQRLIKDSPDNIFFIVSGREDHAAIYENVIGAEIVHSFSMTKFGILDVDAYVRHYLGERNTTLSKKVFELSGGVPLLTLLCVESLREFPDQSFEDIFGSGRQTSSKEQEILELGAIRFLRYLPKASDLLLLTQLTAITQIDSSSKHQRNIVEWTFDRAMILSAPAQTLAIDAAQSFSSVFIGPAKLHPDIRKIVLHDLIAQGPGALEGRLETLIAQAGRVLSDLLEIHNEQATLGEYPSERSDLMAHYVNISAWSAPEKGLETFLQECLERSIGSFKELERFLSLLSDTRLERVLPDLARDNYQRLLENISRPTFLRFLKGFPLSKVTPNLRTLFEVVRLGLEIHVEGSTRESAEELVKQGKVSKQLMHLTEILKTSNQSPVFLYELSGLAEAYISFSQVLKYKERFAEEFDWLKRAMTFCEKLPGPSAKRRLHYGYLRLANIAVLLEDAIAAQTYARKALELLPEDRLTIAFNKNLSRLFEVQASKLNAEAFNLLRQSARVDSQVIQKIEEALELNPENVEIHNRAIRAYRRNRQYVRALEASHRLLEIDPLHISGLTGRGEVFYELGDFAAAVRVFVKCCVRENSQAAIL